MNDENLTLSVEVRKNTKYFVAVSDALDLTGQGKTMGAAIKSLGDAVELFFDVADEDDMAKYLPRLKANPAQ